MGHFGLERFKNVVAYNMGSQVPCEELIAKAKEVNADPILVSQTVTQKDIPSNSSPRWKSWLKRKASEIR